MTELDVWNTLKKLRTSLSILRKEPNPPKKRLETEEYVYQHILDNFRTTNVFLSEC